MLLNFYETILPHSGHYCLFKLPQAQHVWASSLEELAALTLERRDKTGVYFGTASFLSTENRKASNVLALRSLRLDIDAGPDKLAKHGPDAVYATQGEALADAVRFFKATGLAPSLVISSGAGLHIYYCMTEDVAPAVWLPMAKRLSQLGKEHGVKIDTTVTEDAARILRPVGALHHEGCQVKLLRDTGARYSAADLAAKLGVAVTPVRAKAMQTVSLNDDLELKVEGPPKSALKVAEHCSALRHVANARGDVSEPLWRAMLGLVKHTTEGIEAAQAWSQGHDEYDSEKTEAKFNAWSAGPTSCSEFAKHCESCDQCKHQGKIKSPIVLGYLTVPEVAKLPPEKQPPPPAIAAPTGDPWDGRLPPGYKVHKGKDRLSMIASLKIEAEDENGDTTERTVEVPFTHVVFWLGQWAEAADSNDTACVTLHVWIDGTVKSYLMDQSLIASRGKLLEYLAGKSILTTSNRKASAAMEDFIKASLEQIRTMHKRPKIANRFGMRITPKGELICAQGKHVIYPDGTIREGMLTASLESMSAPFTLPLPPNDNSEWGPEVWKTHLIPAARRHAEFLRRHYGDPALGRYQLAITMGLSSPLMPFMSGTYLSGELLPASCGMSVSLISREGARGKTSVFRAVMMAFGDSDTLVTDKNDQGTTALARVAVLAGSGTLPTTMDEMSTTNELTLTEMIRSVANGTTRIRLDKTGRIVQSPPFALVNLIGANRSQRDMINAANADSPAVQHRLIEMDVNDLVFTTGDQGDYRRDYGELKPAVAGALGAVLHLALCRMGAARVNKLVAACVEDAFLLGEQHGEAVDSQNGRLQWRALGATLALQKILKSLGLDIFDTTALVTEFAKAQKAGREYVKENALPTGGVSLLALFFSEMRANLVITERETDRRTGNQHWDVIHNARMPDNVMGRVVVGDGRDSSKYAYISSNALRDWCVSKKVSTLDLLRECKAAGIFLPIDSARHPGRVSHQIDMLKGTRESQAARSSCYKIHTELLWASQGGEIDLTAPVAAQ